MEEVVITQQSIFVSEQFSIYTKRPEIHWKVKCILALFQSLADFEKIMGARVGELLTVLVLGEQPLKYHLGHDGNLFGW